MSSSESSPRPIDKSSYKFKPITSYDLFYQLTYMSGMSAAGLGRNQTFEAAAQCESGASQYFVAINQLVSDLRYDYSDACRTIATTVDDGDARSFLLRFADALRSGELLATFLQREAQAQADIYQNSYDQELEALKKWTDAFTSILISSALIIVINLVNSMIYPVSTTMLASLVFTSVAMGGFGAWVLWRAAPKEVMSVSSAIGSVQQRLALTLSRILIPVAFMVAALLYLLDVNIGITLAVFGLTILPVGVISYRAVGIISKKESEISSLFRSTGALASSTGTTLREALDKIDLDSFPTLKPDVDRLRMRLRAMVEPAVCWQQFGLETGSKVIAQASEIFEQGISMGGDPEQIGTLCAMFTSRTTNLRARRRVVAGTFSWLTMVMQGAVAGLMVFVLEIVSTFTNTMAGIAEEQAASGGRTMPLGSFDSINLPMLQLITLTMVVLLAVVSALAIIASDGSYKLKLSFYIAILMTISGACFWFVPPAVANLLTI